MATVKKSEPTQALPRLKPGPKKRPIDYNRTQVAFRNAADFGPYVEGYPDKTGLMAYFYRLEPKIDLTRVGLTDSFIHKSTDSAEMTAEFCAARWGRGRYMVKLNDANRAAGAREVARVWFDIDDPDSPPVYDPRALLVNDPANADEVARLIALGVLVRDGDFSAPRVNTGQPVAPPVVAPVLVPPPAFAGNIGDQLIIKLLDRALPSATPQTATDVLEQSFQIADRLRPAPVAGPTMEQMIEAVVLRLRPVVAPPAPSGGIVGDLETYERVGGLLDRLGAGRALDAGGSMPGWAVMLGPMLENIVKPLVPLLGALIASKVAPGPPAAPGPFPAQRGPVAAVQAPALVLLAADAPIMDRVVQVAQLAFQKSAEGVSGFRFASWLCGYYPGGAEVYAFLEGAGGTTECMGMMSMVPDLQAQLLDPLRSAALEVWLDDFFTYNQGGPEVEPGPGVAAAA